ncbi:uncharacterized protein LOC123264029 [Cotesia glomerata]|uniref:uncharacterized protein LOC123264029 n=1 Tax=Cotesia glomerata TaxID=32391 RepID=UPI001D022CAD|nr:uncharacterized protein LOC123264029 [Cotesia glomerata]
MHNNCVKHSRCGERKGLLLRLELLHHDDCLLKFTRIYWCEGHDKIYEVSSVFVNEIRPTCAVTAAEQSIVELVQASIEGHEEKTLRVDPGSNDCKVPPENVVIQLGSWSDSNEDIDLGVFENTDVISTRTPEIDPTSDFSIYDLSIGCEIEIETEAMSASDHLSYVCEKPPHFINLIYEEECKVVHQIMENARAEKEASGKNAMVNETESAVKELLKLQYETDGFLFEVDSSLAETALMTEKSSVINSEANISSIKPSSRSTRKIPNNGPVQEVNHQMELLFKIYEPIVGNAEHIDVSTVNFKVTKQSLTGLFSPNCLKDEIINVYLKILERDSNFTVRVVDTFWYNTINKKVSAKRLKKDVIEKYLQSLGEKRWSKIHEKVNKSY